jgi:hypothetical protein
MMANLMKQDTTDFVLTGYRYPGQLRVQLFDDLIDHQLDPGWLSVPPGMVGAERNPVAVGPRPTLLPAKRDVGSGEHN